MVTDFERLVVAWDLWRRRSAATVSGARLSPLIVGAALSVPLVSGVLRVFG